MHIPDSMLQGNICPVTAVVSAAGIITAAVYAVKSEKKPTAARFGAVAALIFAAQMMNFPIAEGTSGHLLGGVLAAALLGTPFAVLAIAAVVTLQSLVFADGGVTVLGANILNMSLIGAGLGGMVYSKLASNVQKSSIRHFIAGSVAWFAVVAASVAVSVELAISGAAQFSTVLVAMLTTHAMIGIGEGIITVALCFLFANNRKTDKSAMSVAAPLGAAVVIALICSPFASEFPDGLEWVAEKYSLFHESAPAFVGILPDYTFPVVSNAILSTGLAGICGVILTFIVCFITAKICGRSAVSAS